jgi:hypothetical protein
MSLDLSMYNWLTYPVCPYNSRGYLSCVAFVIFFFSVSALMKILTFIGKDTMWRWKIMMMAEGFHNMEQQSFLFVHCWILHLGHGRHNDRQYDMAGQTLNAVTDQAWNTFGPKQAPCQ